MNVTERPYGEDGARWFVVRTRPSREVVAEQNLCFQSFETFLPFNWATVRHSRRFRKVKAPVFPGYLFVSLDLGRDRWLSINSTVGVAKLVMAGERPIPVPRGLVEELMTLATRQGGIEYESHLREGDRVRLLSGPFASFIGQLETIDSAGRVKLLLDIMGSARSVWTEARRLALAS